MVAAPSLRKVSRRRHYRRFLLPGAYRSTPEVAKMRQNASSGVLKDGYYSFHYLPKAGAAELRRECYAGQEADECEQCSFGMTRPDNKETAGRLDSAVGSSQISYKTDLLQVGCVAATVGEVGIAADADG